MPFPFLALGAALGGAGAIGKTIFGFGQRKQAKKINPIWSQYNSSPFAAQQLSTAKNFLNGRMAGASQLERNIASNQANTISNINRNATDSSQALALAAATQGQADNSYQNLALNEAQNKYSMLNNLNQAYAQNIQEGDKVYNSQLQKYMMDTQQKQALLGAGAQNIFSGIGDLSSFGIQAGQLFGKKKTNQGVDSTTF